MSETRRQVGVGARRELDDVAAGERAEVGDRPRERGERGPARLVRQRHMHLTPRRERLDQAPFRSRQVLEAVGEDRGAVPRAELARQALDGPPANHAAIADGKPLELGPVGARQLGQARTEILGIEQAGLDLGERAGEGVGETGKARRRPERARRRRGDEVPEHECCAPHRRASAATGRAAGEECEQRVERADRSCEQRSAPAGELALDPVDVDAIRDDQPGITIEGSDEPVEQKRNLAGMCRANHERETHQPIVVRPFAAASLRGAHRRKLREPGGEAEAR